MASARLEQALDVCEKLAQRSKSNQYIHKQHARDMKFNAKIASLLTILAYATLEVQEGMVSLTEADINKIKKGYKAKHNRDLELEGLEFEDGRASLSEETLVSIEELYNKDPQGSAAGTAATTRRRWRMVQPQELQQDRKETQFQVAKEVPSHHLPIWKPGYRNWLKISLPKVLEQIQTSYEANGKIVEPSI
jgi:hypothetical protein